MLWWKILWDIILFRWHHQVRTKAYLSWTEYPSELKSRSRLCHSNLLIWIFQLLWQLTVKINKVWNLKSIKVFFFYLGFLSWTFTIRRTAEEKGGYLFNSPLPLPPASQTVKHYPGDYCRELAAGLESWTFGFKASGKRSPISHAPITR